jgi:ssDNA-binding Zn-finger/Zn-ribbon topoisomerase 1
MGHYDVWCRACGCIMKLRRGKFGEFWGCTGFPHCKNTLNKRDAALNYILDDEEPTIRERWED